MAEGPERGDRAGAPKRVEEHRMRRVASVGLMLLALGLTAALAYDHRRADLGDGWTALPDGRVVSIDSSGLGGPQSVVLVGHRSATVRSVPPVLRHSTRSGPVRGPGGFAISPNGWMLMRLGELGHDTEGGEITEISPSGALVVSLPLLHWTDASIIGITDEGLAVFRLGATVNLLGPDGEAVRMLELGELGVRRSLANLADVALAPDGRLAVLVGDTTASDGYDLYERRAGGASNRVVRIAREDLFASPTSRGDHPVIAFTGEDIAIVGQSGLVQVHDGRVQRRATLASADRHRVHPGSSTMVALTDGRWAIGRSPLVVLDRSGHLHHPGFGPCPAFPDHGQRCPAVIAGHRLPRPTDVLPVPAATVVAIGLLALTWVGRDGRAGGARLRLAATVCGVGWVSAWLTTSLIWGDLHGSAPLLLSGAAMTAILAPAFPRIDRRDLEEPADELTSDEPWVTDRIVGRTSAARSAKRLEVIPLPSRP